MKARKLKAERTKDLGSPIKLTGLALDIHIRDNYAWIAENTSVIRKVNLEASSALLSHFALRKILMHRVVIDRKDRTAVSRAYSAGYVISVLRERWDEIYY